MAVDHRRNIQLYGAAGDLVANTRRIGGRLALYGHAELAEWLQRTVLGVVVRVVDDDEVEPALARVTVALGASAARLGPGRPILRAEHAIGEIRRWSLFDPIRDGPPRFVRRPVLTPVPD